MSFTLLFGLPTTAWMVVSGNCSGTDAHTCNLPGRSYASQFGAKPQAGNMEMTLTMDADWNAGELTFGESILGVSGGLPVKRTACQS